MDARTTDGASAGHAEVLVSYSRVAFDRSGNHDLVGPLFRDSETAVERRGLTVGTQIIVVVREIIRRVAHDIVCGSARQVTRAMQIIMDGRVPKDPGVSEVRIVGWRPKLVTEGCRVGGVERPQKRSSGEIVRGELSVGIVWKMPNDPLSPKASAGKRMTKHRSPAFTNARGRTVVIAVLGSSRSELQTGGNFVWRILIVRHQLPIQP
jgi:hypothetical protein